jgi:pimeloyl-ACP methyl ester carboxylesterase
VENGLRQHLCQVSEEHGQKVSLIGWSLGGIYARQLAKAMPEAVRSVITLGTPFNGSPRSTNAWRLYELASGERADGVVRFLNHPVEGAPLVPTTSIYSRTDGVCAWQVCREDSAANRESIEVSGSHTGLGHHPAVVFAIADRLSQKEGEWRPFQRSGVRAYFFPRTER